MIKFITKSSINKRGRKYVNFDINITVGKDTRRGKDFGNYARIGLRNGCYERFEDDYVALAYDESQKTLYIIPEHKISEDMRDSINCYHVCGITRRGDWRSGKCVKTSAQELIDFITKNNLTGYNDLKFDASTGWFKVEVRTPDVKFI